VEEIMKRALLFITLVGVVWLGGQVWVQDAQTPRTTPPAVSAGQQAPVPTPTVTGELSFAATGDSILLRPVSVYENDPAFEGMLKLVRSATVAFTNFEMSVFDTAKFEPTPQAEYGGLWVHGSPTQAKELKWLGFDMVSRANNHTTDYGVEGMLETNEILDALGIVHAGSGRTLGHARAPAYFQTAIGRIAMISTASSHSPSSRATYARPDIKGRPGLNPLRWNRELFVEPATFAKMKEVIDSVRTGPPPAQPPPPDEINMFGTRVKKGDKTRVQLVADERDINEILTQVRSARRQADFVFVTIHAHEPGNGVEPPADFLPGFARATIDAGADMFIGHGPHMLRGIEIYKGKPIFYSLANFFFHYQTLEPQAYDVFESRTKLDPLRATVADLYDAVPGWGTAFREDIWWESVIALSQFEAGRMKSIVLHPIELGHGLPRSQKGTPRLADRAVAQKIIERLARLSKPFGTNIRFVDGVGVIELPTATH
jgi:poly-gamma-glutamate capsule biosynthesis protein CapA/YwtB (metallophosphatase superfamily)